MITDELRALYTRIAVSREPRSTSKSRNVGYTLWTLGRLEDALPLEQRALQITETALPAGHPTITLGLDNLAQTLTDLGRGEEALPLRQRAAENRATRTQDK
jgi:tetratricopeptide (TPR) repeat protein